MGIEIKQVDSCRKKKKICNDILRSLPHWFGVEDSIVDYSEQVKDMLFLVAFDSVNPVGFAAIKNHNDYTAEVYVMGVLKNWHRGGVGRQLITVCENICVAAGKEFLTVKTLDESRENESYEKTRLFYFSMGFRPLEVFPLLWDRKNPCLFLTKNIGKIVDIDSG